MLDAYIPTYPQQNVAADLATELLKLRVEQTKNGKRCGEVELEMILRIEEMAKAQKGIAEVAAQDFAKDIKDVQRLVRAISSDHSP